MGPAPPKQRLMPVRKHSFQSADFLLPTPNGVCCQQLGQFGDIGSYPSRLIAREWIGIGPIRRSGPTLCPSLD
jgi:hypothetical protein